MDISVTKRQQTVLFLDYTVVLSLSTYCCYHMCWWCALSSCKWHEPTCSCHRHSEFCCILL